MSQAHETQFRLVRSAPCKRSRERWDGRLPKGGKNEDPDDDDQEVRQDADKDGKQVPKDVAKLKRKSPQILPRLFKKLQKM
jgi:hypothetical protein